MPMADTTQLPLHTATQQPSPVAPVPAPAKPKSLVGKLAEVMGAIGTVAKNGRNDFHNYDYATEADVADAVRGEMAKRGLIMVPTIKKAEWDKVQTKSGFQRLCTLTVGFTIMDADSEQTICLEWIGEGADAGDKASYKASTGAEKYALLKLFMIATKKSEGEPESESPDLTPADDPGYQPQQQRPAARSATPSPSRAPAGRVALVPFGNEKGKPVTEISLKSIRWHIAAASEKLMDKSKAKWHQEAREWRDACVAEERRRNAADTPSPASVHDQARQIADRDEPPPFDPVTGEQF